MFVRFNAWLSKLVGPNAAHVLDALIGVALVGAVAVAYSAPARAFLVAHATLGLVVGAAIPLVTALASKFRKAAGSSTGLADAISGAVIDALQQPPVTATPIDVNTLIPQVSHLIKTPEDIAPVVAAAVAAATPPTSAAA